MAAGEQQVVASGSGAAPGAEGYLRLEGVRKDFDGVLAVDEIDLSLSLIHI